MEPFIRINGKKFPYPAPGAGFIVATVVDAGRNANGVIVAQRLGRDQQKIDNTIWPHLTAKVWSEMLIEFDKFFITVEYPDMVRNRWTTRDMYVGDRSAVVWKLDRATGLPSEYIQCKANIIDVGKKVIR